MNLEVNGHNIFLMLAITFLISLVLIPLIKKIALHIGAVSAPDTRKGETWHIHDKPIPRMGGVAIFFSFLIGYMFFAQTSAQMNAILIGGIIVIMFGLFDDIKTIKARYRIIPHFIAACIVVFYGNIYIPNIHIFGTALEFGVLGYPLAIFFIMGAINAINLIDGLDGLSSGISSIYFATISILAFILNLHGGLDVTISILMLGATLGFLVYNFHPASIFIGDSGTGFLGYIIAVIALLGFKGATLTSLFVPILILFVPIIDTLFAIVRRLIKGQSIGKGDKEHLHHQILKFNNSPRKTVLIIYAITVLCAAISIFYALGDNMLAIFLYILLMGVLFFLILKTDILFKRKAK